MHGIKGGSFHIHKNWYPAKIPILTASTNGIDHVFAEYWSAAKIPGLPVGRVSKL